MSEIIGNGIFVGGGSGGSQNILGGSVDPTSNIGSDGDIYIKYTDYDNPPSGYNILEYIDNDVTGRIDTGVPGNTADLKVEIWYRPNSGYTNDNSVFGAALATYGFFFSLDGGRYKFHSRGSVVLDGSASVSDFYHCILSTSEMNIEGTAYQMGGSGSNSSDNISIFNIPGTNKVGSGKLNRMIIYTGETVIRDFVPAKRISDDELGLYDLENDVFYTNVGTGTFIGGEIVEGKPIESAYLKVDGSWVLLENGNWDDVNTGS